MGNVRAGVMEVKCDFCFTVDFSDLEQRWAKERNAWERNGFLPSVPGTERNGNAKSNFSEERNGTGTRNEIFQSNETGRERQMKFFRGTERKIKKMFRNAGER